jgi:hypothetical protein
VVGYLAEKRGRSPFNWGRNVIVLDTYFNKVFPWRYHLDYGAI